MQKVGAPGESPTILRYFNLCIRIVVKNYSNNSIICNRNRIFIEGIFDLAQVC